MKLLLAVLGFLALAVILFALWLYVFRGWIEGERPRIHDPKRQEIDRDENGNPDRPL